VGIADFTVPGLPAAELMRLPIEWAEDQFRSLCGAARRIDRWIDTL
jgi:hypothetical protein